MDALTFILENGDTWLQYAARVTILNENKESLADLRLKALSESKIKRT